MKKLIATIMMLALVFCSADAQSILKRLKNTVKNAAENTLNRKVGEKVEEAVSDGIDNMTKKKETEKKEGEKDSKSKAAGKTSYSSSANRDLVFDDWDYNDQDRAEAGGGSVPQTASAEKPQEKAKVNDIEAVYAKSDFVAGDEIIFDDDMANEQMGEFPSQWDLFEGVSEVASINGKKAFVLSKRYSCIGPLMKTPQNYLGDIFTVEFDFMPSKSESDYGTYFRLRFHTSEQKSSYDGDVITIEKFLGSQTDNDERLDWEWEANSGKLSGEEESVPTDMDVWHHVAISFNKRALKVYIDGVRYINVPNVSTPPGWFDLSLQNGNGKVFFTNFSIAKGAVPLYDRMMSDGKFITYGITFDVGKSVVKPESMGEINRIVKLMTDNPDLKFSVEGHTDNTGGAAANQTLSEARSKAIVDKLVEMGIDSGRLTSSGKGQSSPVADNSTDEGRAKNRRVEFVKQ